MNTARLANQMGLYHFNSLKSRYLVRDALACNGLHMRIHIHINFLFVDNHAGDVVCRSLC